MFNASQAFSLAIMAMNMPSWVAAQKEIMPEEKAAEVDEKELFSLFGLWSISYLGITVRDSVPSLGMIQVKLWNELLL